MLNGGVRACAESHWNLIRRAVCLTRPSRRPLYLEHLAQRASFSLLLQRERTAFESRELVFLLQIFRTLENCKKFHYEKNLSNGIKQRWMCVERHTESNAEANTENDFNSISNSLLFARPVVWPETRLWSQPTSEDKEFL